MKAKAAAPEPPASIIGCGTILVLRFLTVIPPLATPILCPSPTHIDPVEM